MPWVRTDDNAPNHPKNFRAGVASFGFDVAGICYCNRNLTDGFIPAQDLPLVFPGLTMGRALALASKLVEVGRWEKQDDPPGWRIHDYLHYQPTKTEALAQRRREHDRRVLGGQVRASMGARVNGRFVSQLQASNAPARQVDQLTSSHPIPSRPIPKKEELLAHAGFARFWSLYPHKVGKEKALEVWRKKNLEPKAEEICTGLERTMAHVTRDGGQFIPLPATWLNQGRWADEPKQAALINASNLAGLQAFVDGHK